MRTLVKLTCAREIKTQLLPYFLPLERDGSVLVKPSSEILYNGARQWENALLGNFLGKSPPLGIFQKTLDRLWGREGSIDIRFLAPSVYVLNFPSQKVRDWVLESRSWHIQQKAIVLRKWLLGMIPGVLDLTSTPIWVKLWHVPLDLFSHKGLGCIANALGKPLYTDRATVLKHILEFAKICINVGAKSVLPKSVKVELSDDTVVGTVVADLVPIDHVQSQNPFSVLVDGQVPEVSPRKTRAAAEGVAELIN
ncbi:hypothetical protein V6N13_033242 [Hibiscus sabdariffa]